MAAASSARDSFEENAMECRYKVARVMLSAGLILSAGGCVPSYRPKAGSEASSGPSSGIAQAGPSQTWFAGSHPPNGTLATLVAQINAQRNAASRGSLTWHDGLAAVALAHSDDMAQRDYLSVINPDGHDVFQALVAARPPMQFDNAFAFVFQAPPGPSVFPLLMADQGAAQALMDPNMTHIGIQLNFYTPTPQPGYDWYTLIVGQKVSP
jgi:uncharacterized protein YkwD